VEFLKELLRNVGYDLDTAEIKLPELKKTHDGEVIRLEDRVLFVADFSMYPNLNLIHKVVEEKGRKFLIFAGETEGILEIIELATVDGKNYEIRLNNGILEVTFKI